MIDEHGFNARKEAVECFLDIMEQQGYSSIVLDRRIRQYPPSVSSKDKALVTNLVYTTLTHCITLDALLDRYSKTPVRRMKSYIAAVLRISCAQLMYFDKIPQRAVIHEAVELVKHSAYRGLSGFVNGVLRAIQRNGCRMELPGDPLERLSIQWSIPMYMLRLWETAYGLETAALLARRSVDRKPVSVRCNSLCITPGQLQEELEQQLGQERVRRSPVCDAVFYLDTAENLRTWEAMKKGHMMVQDESSVLAALATGVRPGMQALDMCAAPGGKSMCMADMMENQGRIVSCDIHEHKLELIRQNAEHLGITCVHPMLRDGTLPVPEDRERYDAVLLDAPCSGLGILRSKPDIRYHHKEADIDELSSLQRTLLCQAQQYVKPGGRLVYSTCTITPQENERNAAWFLREFPNFIMGNLEKDLPTLHLCDTIKDSRKPGWCTILPQEAGRDGFFIATFTKALH